MELFYRSTRNENVMLTASEAILQGLSDEGGLFVPEDSGAERVPFGDCRDGLSGDCLYGDEAVSH